MGDVIADDKVVQEVDQSGHINNLSSDQEEALKQLWKRLLDTVEADGGLGKIRERDQANGKGENLSKAHDKPPSANPAASGDVETKHAPNGSDGAGGKKKSPKRPSDDDAVNTQATLAEEEASLTELLAEKGPAELHKAFWQFCMHEDPDALLLRFLRARKWDVSKAFSMLASTLKWRMETNLFQIQAAGEEGLCKEEGVLKNFTLGKTYYRGTDREGRPLIFARVKQHKASDQTQDEMLKFIVYNMEISRTLFPLASGIETSSVVFDMTGFGLSNMDWDTATMVINIFQSYYPETLGHAIVWKAPTVFSAAWKIIKPMLDPVVREKIAFCSNAKEIAKYIDPKHLEKDFGGTSSWSYEFKTPIEGENKQMDDIDTREIRMNKFVDVAERLEELTKKWVNGDNSVAEERREKVLKELLIRRFDLDPYIRGRSSFDRDGTVVGDGQVVWHYNHGRSEKFGRSADDWAKELGIEDPPSRPHNESAYDDDDELTLDSAEDTMSSTDPSEDDPLDDPHHRHHSAVTVGFAKLGDKIANTASKVTPGPSLHEKRRQQRQRKHEEHEKRRQKKLALKKARLEKERKEQEEREMTEQEEEEAINNSYLSYLSSMGNLTLEVGNKVADYVPAVVGGNYLKSLTDTTDTTPAPATTTETKVTKTEVETETVVENTSTTKV